MGIARAFVYVAIVPSEKSAPANLMSSARWK
jgi:hypothetical protein